jgi:calcineurin-like phosphoesterase
MPSSLDAISSIKLVHVGIGPATPGIAEELFDLGAHVITTGNHVWDKREIIEYMQSVPWTATVAPAACCGLLTTSPGLQATDIMSFC